MKTENVREAELLNLSSFDPQFEERKESEAIQGFHFLKNFIKWNVGQWVDVKD